jgi:hypothetical protein
VPRAEWDAYSLCRHCPSANFHVSLRTISALIGG